MTESFSRSEYWHFYISTIFLQFGEHVYWTDWQSRSIERVNKKTGRDQVTVQDGMEGLMDIHIVARSRQTGG